MSTSVMGIHPLFWNLQIFGEGGDGGAGAAPGGAPGPGSQGVEAAGVQAPDAGEQTQRKLKTRAQSSRIPDVVYGKPAPEEQTASTAVSGPAEQQEEPQTESWADVKKRYKEEYGKDVQAAIQGRFKENKAAEDERNQMVELLTRLGGAKYEGVVGEDGKLDLKKLAQAVDEDDEIYEAKAAERGMSVETYKHVEQLEREAAERKARDEAEARERQMYAEYQQVKAQAEEARKFYPSLDLMKEMDDPQFARLIRAGVPVKTAYQVRHADEITAAMMQHAAAQQAQAISDSIQAGAARPSENGLGRQSAANVTRLNDPRTWSKANRKDVRDRVARGEKIYL